MVEFIICIAKLEKDLTSEERRLLSIGHKNFLGAKCASEKILTAIELKEDKGTNLKLMCKKMIETVDEHLFPTVSNVENSVFYYTMKDDCYQFLAKFIDGSEKRKHQDQALNAYMIASKTSEKSLPPTNSVRLNLVVRMSAFLYEMEGSPNNAFRVTKQAFDEAISVIESLDEEGYQDCMEMMKVLRDNLRYWKSRMAGKEHSLDTTVKSNVCDMPQVHCRMASQMKISYKWLSRNFSVSSNDAKRLLQEFVNKNGADLQVIYSVSGWLKNNPQNYCVKLTSGPKLEEARQEFKDSCSVQVYSIQASIPKDTAVLWNPEFVQAEELFNQPFDEENCLRDNRFCGVLNSFVKRTSSGKHVSSLPPKPANNPAATAQPKPSPKLGAGNKSEKDNSTVFGKAGNAPVVKEPSITVDASKNKAQNGKALPGNGGSLANMWGRASAKPNPPTTTNSAAVAATADAQICAKEEADADSSDDEQGIKYKMGSSNANNRKTRAVFNFSDDEEDDNIVSIASPEPSKQHASDPVTETAEDTEVNKKNLENKDGISNNSKDCSRGLDSEFNFECNTKSVNTTNHSGITLKEKSSDPPVKDNKQGSTAEPASTSPKRRKVLKTRIDERGREVTEVVWEGEASDKTDKNVNTTSASGNLKDNSTVFGKAGNAPIVKEPSITVDACKNKAQNSKALPGNGGSLANMWGRASKPNPPTTTNSAAVAATADAQICAKEEADADNSDDEQGIKYKRGSSNANNRKRRAVFNFSEEEDDSIVSIASPEPSKQHASDPVTETAEDIEVNKKNLENKDGISNNAKDCSWSLDSEFDSECKTKSVNTMNHSGITLKEKNSDPPIKVNKQGSTAEPASTSPKRRKVLKTRIDERGREGTYTEPCKRHQVVWEGEASDKTEKNVNTTSVSGAAPPSKPQPAAPPSKPQPAANTDKSKAPSKAAGNKKQPAKAAGAKQGSIMSFFKKV